ncbi:MAG: glycoside hydrolase family 30 protein [Deltaproteobacteria bacterium]
MKKKVSFFLFPAIISMMFLECKKETQKFVLKNEYVKVFTTSKDSIRDLSKSEGVEFKDLIQPLETQICIFVEPEKTFQSFIGIGGAITDASAEVFAKLSPQKQEELINSYFDSEKGLGYSIIRTNMNSCDFSSSSYTYVKENDRTLSSFNIDQDKKYKIPMIKKALGRSPGSKVFFSPWSPPAYMKTNKNMLKGGKLLPEFNSQWANYYVKFIENYKTEGINIWGLTIQNEPMATQRWESCIYTAEEERDFLKNYLGPALAKSKMKDKKVIIWDHNRDLITHRVNCILSDREAAKYVWGIGFHWYENWSGGDMMFENIDEIQKLYPEMKLVFTEGCADSYKKDELFNWLNAEKYARSMINDFNNGTVIWTDWNILLDENGGPNHVGNFCFAPVHADLRSGQLIYTPSYYYIGHFSKFVSPGDKRISSVSSRSQLLTTSFINASGSISTIVMNPTENSILYNLCVKSRAAEIEIPPRSIQTLRYQ